MSKEYRKFVPMSQQQLDAAQSLSMYFAKEFNQEEANRRAFLSFLRLAGYAPSTARKKWQHSFKATKYGLEKPATVERTVKRFVRQPIDKVALEVSKAVRKKIEEAREVLRAKELKAIEQELQEIFKDRDIWYRQSFSWLSSQSDRATTLIYLLPEDKAIKYEESAERLKWMAAVAYAEEYEAEEEELEEEPEIEEKPIWFGEIHQKWNAKEERFTPTIGGYFYLPGHLSEADCYFWAKYSAGGKGIGYAADYIDWERREASIMGKTEIWGAYLTKERYGHRYTATADAKYSYAT